MRRWAILGRSLRLRCVACGEGRLFAGWFRMQPACARCGLRFEREPGYYLGSIYFNYGLTALVVTATYIPLALLGFSPQKLLVGLTMFCVLFPLWFFRYARALWLGMDYYYDPPSDGS